MSLIPKELAKVESAVIYYSWFNWNCPYSVKYNHNSLITHFATEHQARRYVEYMTERREDLLVRKLKGQ